MAMTVDQFVKASYLMATGKDTPPVQGTTKYSKLIDLANIFSQAWASEPGVDWQSLRTTYTLSATVTATDTFALPTGMGKISDQEGDFVRVNWPDGTHETDFTIVPAQRLYDSGPKRGASWLPWCATMGTNLVFADSFTSSSPELGGTITVPGYAVPATLANPTDLIQVDDPYWLVYRAAAEYVRTDLTRQQQYPNLVAMATEAMQGMKERDDTQESVIYRGEWQPFGQTRS